MLIKGVNDKAMCWMFKGKTHQTTKSWFKSLNAGSVSCLDPLITEFVHEFGYAASHDQATFKLAFIKEGESKSLADYVACFH